MAKEWGLLPRRRNTRNESAQALHNNLYGSHLLWIGKVGQELIQQCKKSMPIVQAPAAQASHSIHGLSKICLKYPTMRKAF